MPDSLDHNRQEKSSSQQEKEHSGQHGKTAAAVTTSSNDETTNDSHGQPANGVTPNSQESRETPSDSYPYKLGTMLTRMEDKAHEKIFKRQYTKRECTYVFYAGFLGSFNYGFVNGSCLSGLLSATGQSTSVGGLTGHYTQAGLALAAGDTANFGYYACLILSYMMGSFLTGLVAPNARPYQIDPKYGPIFLLGAIFLFVASLIAALEHDLQYAFYFACAANGLQNGMASLYSANLIRCSMTGSSIDVALILAKAIRGNRHGIWRLAMISVIIINFFLGGLCSFWAASHFLHLTLLFNSGLFLLIGVLLAWFIVKELKVSVPAALCGTWVWNSSLLSRLKFPLDAKPSPSKDNGEIHTSETIFLVEMFDEIDEDKNGVIDFQELLMALLNTDPDITPDEVKILIEQVDNNGDGVLDRNEWACLVENNLPREQRKGTA